MIILAFVPSGMRTCLANQSQEDIVKASSQYNITAVTSRRNWNGTQLENSNIKRKNLVMGCARGVTCIFYTQSLIRIHIQACVGVKEALSAGTLYNDTCKHYTVSSNKKGSFRHLLINNGQLDFRIDRVDDVQTRLYSSPPRRKGFISGVLENIKEEISKNKEMKDNIKKFREEAEKLEQSDALKKARRKYERMESETSKNSEVLKQRLDEIKSKLSETIEQAQKTEIAKRSKEISEEIGRSAREAAEVVGKSGKRLGDSAAFKSISEGVKAVKEEIDESKLTHSQVYRAPRT
ncbi:TIMM44 (predicted) [Pycnogonum litorale]